MHPYEADFIGVKYKGPFTSATQTVMSAPFCAALAWASGGVTFDGLRHFDDGTVNDLVKNVDIVADADRKRYEPHITVTLQNDERLMWVEESGDSGYRMHWKAAVGMAKQLGREVNVPTALVEQLIGRVAGIEHETSVCPLIAAVCAAIAASSQ
jgi:hypothetical protein